MNELDALIIQKSKDVPLKERGLIIIGGRFVIAKSRYASLKLCAACRRIGKAIVKAFRIDSDSS